MSEETRMQQIEKQLQVDDSRFTHLEAKSTETSSDLKDLKDSVAVMQNRFTSLDQRLQDILDNQAKFERIQLQATTSIPQSEVSHGLLPRPPDRLIPVAGRFMDLSGSSSSQLKIPKVEFPTFDGSNVRTWLQKSNRFFQVNPVADLQRSLFASLHFKGRAETWFQTESSVFERMSWNEFQERIRARFDEEVYENVVGEFSKLIQTGSLQEYLDKFEALQPLVLLKNKGLSESFFIDSFISGLKDEIRHTVQMFQPNNFTQAVSIARLQEATLESLTRTQRGNLFRSSKFTSPVSSPYKQFNSPANTSSQLWREGGSCSVILYVLILFGNCRVFNSLLMYDCYLSADVI
ncbi:hypothetical protein ACHQM5_020511 [Ranunculus cassubicifolius]